MGTRSAWGDAVETSWRFRGDVRVRTERRPSFAQAFALTRARRVRFLAFTLAR